MYGVQAYQRNAEGDLERFKELLAKEFKVPGRGVVTERQKAWMRIFGAVFENVEMGRSLR